MFIANLTGICVLPVFQDSPLKLRQTAERSSAKCANEPFVMNHENFGTQSSLVKFSNFQVKWRLFKLLVCLAVALLLKQFEQEFRYSSSFSD
jgi:hypothetical protein